MREHRAGRCWGENCSSGQLIRAIRLAHAGQHRELVCHLLQLQLREAAERCLCNNCNSATVKLRPYKPTNHSPMEGYPTEEEADAAFRYLAQPLKPEWSICGGKRVLREAGDAGADDVIELLLGFCWAVL